LEFLFKAFGLKNANQALQRLKDNILIVLDYVYSFLDNDGVYSKTKEQHWENPRVLFSILAINGVALSLDKCMFAIAELDFLGHHISTASIAPLRDNIQVILDLPAPAGCARQCNGF
jgi:hypothetical protein